MFRKAVRDIGLAMDLSDNFEHNDKNDAEEEDDIRPTPVETRHKNIQTGIRVK